MIACENATAMIPRVTTMPAEPPSSIGFRPTRSTMRIATTVASTLTSELMTDARNESLSENPTACQSVVE